MKEGMRPLVGGSGLTDVTALYIKTMGVAQIVVGYTHPPVLL